MNRARCISGIISLVLTFLILIFILTSEGAERSERFFLVYFVAGAIFLVLGLVMLRQAAKESDARTKLSNLALLGIVLLLFACTCLMLAEVQRQIQELQKARLDSVSSADVR